MSYLCRKWNTLQFLCIRVLGGTSNKVLVKKRFSAICFSTWLIVACVCNFLHIAIDVQGPSAIIAVLIFGLSAFSSVLVYISLWLKKRQIFTLRKDIKRLSKNETSKAYCLLNIIQLLNFFIFMFYPLLLLMFLVNNNLLMFQNLKESNFRVFVSLLSVYAFFFNQTTLPFFVTLLYANFCLWCSSSLKRVLKKLESCLVIMNEKKVITTLQLYETILQKAMSVEDIFSSVTFLLLCTYFVYIFSSMKYLLSNSLPLFPRIQCSVNFVLGVSGITLLIAYPSETPLVIEKIKLNLVMLEKKLNLRECGRYSEIIKTNIDAFFKTDGFSFSAFRTVYFKRSMIITCYGAMISYGLLLQRLD